MRAFIPAFTSLYALQDVRTLYSLHSFREVTSLIHFTVLATNALHAVYANVQLMNIHKPPFRHILPRFPVLFVRLSQKICPSAHCFKIIISETRCIVKLLRVLVVT